MILFRISCIGWPTPFFGPVRLRDPPTYHTTFILSIVGLSSAKLRLVAIEPNPARNAKIGQLVDHIACHDQVRLFLTSSKSR